MALLPGPPVNRRLASLQRTKQVHADPIPAWPCLSFHESCARLALVILSSPLSHPLSVPSLAASSLPRHLVCVRMLQTPA
jgi:hypothetical protein